MDLNQVPFLADEAQAILSRSRESGEAAKAAPFVDISVRGRRADRCLRTASAGAGCTTTSARVLLVGPDEFGMGQYVPLHGLFQRRLVRLAEIRQHDVQGI